MQSTSDSRRKLKEVIKCLRSTCGRRRWKRGREPVGVLLATVLSQNTSRANSSAGFQNLRRRFATWDRLADARLSDIERCIRVSGLSKVKAPRIRSILRQIRDDRGRVELGFLRNWEPADALAYLGRFEGVGPKTARCVLLFAFGMKLFPVDTHVLRIAIRLGVLEKGASAEKAHELLAPLIAPCDRYEMHVLLIDHGRRTCRARKPQCDRCCILRICPHGQAELQRHLRT